MSKKFKILMGIFIFINVSFLLFSSANSFYKMSLVNKESEQLKHFVYGLLALVKLITAGIVVFSVIAFFILKKYSPWYQERLNKFPYWSLPVSKS